MSTLTTHQIAVLEVFRRLYAAKLPTPSIATVCQLTALKKPTVQLAAKDLVEMQKLEGSWRGPSMRLSEEERKCIDAEHPQEAAA